MRTETRFNGMREGFASYTLVSDGDAQRRTAVMADLERAAAIAHQYGTYVIINPDHFTVKIPGIREVKWYDISSIDDIKSAIRDLREYAEFCRDAELAKFSL